MEDELRETFFLECADLLETLESGLIALSDGTGDAETLNAVFRATHSIKGGAGAFGLTELVRFAHKFETALDEVRQKRLEPTAEVLKVFLRSSDVLSDLVDTVGRGAETDNDAVDGCVADLTKLIESSSGEAEEAVDAGATFEAMALDLDFGPISTDGPVDPFETFEIEFRPFAALYERGNETLLLLRALEALGECETVCEPVAGRMLDAVDPADPGMTWRITLRTEQGVDSLWEVFDFVEGDCALKIRSAAAMADESEEAPAPPAAGRRIRRNRRRGVPAGRGAAVPGRRGAGTGA